MIGLNKHIVKNISPARFPPGGGIRIDIPWYEPCVPPERQVRVEL